MGRVVQVLITHTGNDAFTTDVDEYVKNIFTRSEKNDFVSCKLQLACSKQRELLQANFFTTFI